MQFRDLTANPKIDVYLDQIELQGRNFINRTRADQNLFGHIDLHAQAMHSEDLKLKGLNLTTLNNFFTAYRGFDVKAGDFSLCSEMAKADGNLKDYVKPIIKHLSVADFKRDSKKGLLHAT